MCVINMKISKFKKQKLIKLEGDKLPSIQLKLENSSLSSVINIAIRQITSDDMSGLKSVINLLDILDIYKIIHITIEMKIQHIKNYRTHIKPSFKENL